MKDNNDNMIFTGIPNPNSRCHFNTFHRAFDEYRRCPDGTCDYPMIPQRDSN